MEVWHTWLAVMFKVTVKQNNIDCSGGENMPLSGVVVLYLVNNCYNRFVCSMNGLYNPALARVYSTEF
jgi:hypothetical protein